MVFQDDGGRYVGTNRYRSKEDQALACSTALQADPDLLISAATVAEALIVAERKNVSPSMAALLNLVRFNIIEVSADTAQRVLRIYQTWGKGRHPARLNFGDCFAYDTARHHNCPLLFVGEDFRRTDIVSVL
jgi:ribonuclease VapC